MFNKVLIKDSNIFDLSLSLFESNILVFRSLIEDLNLCHPNSSLKYCSKVLFLIFEVIIENSKLR